MQRPGGSPIHDAYKQGRRHAAALAVLAVCLLRGCAASPPTNPTGSLSTSSSPTDRGPMPTATLQPEVLKLVVCNAVTSAQTDGVTHRVEVVVTTGQRINALRLPDYTASAGPSPGTLTFPPDADVVMAVARGDYRSGIVTSPSPSASAFPPSRFDAIMTFHGVDGNPIEQTPGFGLDQPVVPAPDLSSLGSVQTVPVTSETAACQGIG